MCGTMQFGIVCLYIQWLKIAYGHIWTKYQTKRHLQSIDARPFLKNNVPFLDHFQLLLTDVKVILLDVKSVPFKFSRCPTDVVHHIN